MLRRMRSVVMESGTWRWARRASPGHVIFGNARALALGEVFFYFSLTAVGHVQSLRHQKAIGRDAQGGVVVKAAPAAALEVAQAQPGPESAVLVLDSLSHLVELDQGL